jgi:hypothetical protein
MNRHEHRRDLYPIPRFDQTRVVCFYTRDTLPGDLEPGRPSFMNEQAAWEMKAMWHWCDILHK